MEKVWLNSYPEGVPTDINPDKYASIIELQNEAIRKFASKPAFSNMGTSLTFKEIGDHSKHFANYLKNELYVAKGDRVAIMMPNLLQYPVVLQGIHRAGMVAVNVNPLYTARELMHLLKDSGASTIVILANFAHVLAEIIEDTPVKTVIITEIGDMLGPIKSRFINFIVKNVKKMVPPFKLNKYIELKDALKIGKKSQYHSPELVGSDVAFLQYTGGTTGVSKAAVLTHRNIVANMLQAAAWIRAEKSLGDDEVIVTALPLYHIFSLTANCLTYFYLGANNLLITNPRDMPNFIKTLKKNRFTAITGVNTLFNGLLHQKEFSSLNFKNLKITLGGGMAVQQAVAEKWLAVTGIPLIEAYGLTEASPAVCINPLNVRHYNGSIGLPLPSTDLSIRDENDNELPLGEAGELCIKGPQVMQGYWQQPDETRKVLVDGWLRSGDIATIDEKGFVRIVDRKKDMIIVSGFNVYPNELENVIAMHSMVVEVAVIGVPSESGGEIVKAFIVPSNNALTAEEIKAHCAKYLTNYKIPRIIEFRKELPKSNVGKVLRRELRDEVKVAT